MVRRAGEHAHRPCPSLSEKPSFCGYSAMNAAFFGSPISSLSLGECHRSGKRLPLTGPGVAVRGVGLDQRQARRTPFEPTVLADVTSQL